MSKYRLDSSCVIISLILMTTLFFKAVILQGEMWRWSLLGLKGFKAGSLLSKAPSNNEYHWLLCSVKSATFLPICTFSYSTQTGNHLQISGCVSLLKSKSGFFIQKQIFHFVAKIQTWSIDPNDPQWRWILLLISKTRYFGYMIRSASFVIHNWIIFTGYLFILCSFSSC